MPTLDWIGKQAVVNHHREVPYRLVHCDSDLSAGDPNAGNLLVQGDNLEALRALLPYYAGQVKCIYIDPPYNTGNEGWVYNDNVNSPEIKAWLDTVVGKEGEDLSRHDKWLCMMYPRLRLLREFLREDGVIFVSIDDNENANLTQLLKEIFGNKNHVATLPWFKKVSPSNDAKFFSYDHEYLVCFAQNKDNLSINRMPLTDKQKSYYKNPDDDPRGPWNSSTYTCNKSASERPNLYYSILNPNTGEECWPSKTAVWAYDSEVAKSHVSQNLLYWGKRGDSKKPRFKKFLDKDASAVSRSIWHYDDVGHTQEATKQVNEIFSKSQKWFDTPKPTRLIDKIVRIATNPGDLILDSFAGSGTTGHVVIDVNKQDGGNRRFILVEMDKNISKDVTAERLRRVIGGYDKGGDKSKPVEGLGGGFRFCHLGKPLFDEYGDIAPEVTFPDLAAHIFFSETGVPIPAKAASEYLGTFQDRAVYLLFDAAHAEAPREAVGNVLTPDRLDALPAPPDDTDGKAFDGLRVVYGEGCTVSAGRLKSAGVVFKQIPYQIDGA